MKKWRAKEGCKYYYIDTRYCGVVTCAEYGFESDDTKYKMGNYFKTKKQANEVLKKIKSILKEFHENIK